MTAASPLESQVKRSHWKRHAQVQSNYGQNRSGFHSFAENRGVPSPGAFLFPASNILLWGGLASGVPHIFSFLALGPANRNPPGFPKRAEGSPVLEIRG